MEPEQMKVLRLVQDGKISAEDAQKLLAAMSEEEEPEVEIVEPVPEPPMEQRSREPSHTWMYVAMFGLGWSLVGLALTLWVWGSLWLILVIPFLFLGLLVLAAGLWSRNSAWLSIHISDAHTGRRKFGLNFPVPLTLAAWGVRIARPFVPQFRDTAVDEMILALREGTTGGEQLLVDVVDDEDGERVQVRIG